MDIEIYTKKQLREILENNYFSQYNNLPITQMRLLSQVNNPVANEDDALLLVAYSGSNSTKIIVGYFSLLPAYLNIHNEQKKIFWGSAWWADANFTQFPVGTYLLLGLLECCDNQFSVSNFTPSAEKLYSSCGELSVAQFLTGKDFIFQFPKINETKSIKLKIKNLAISLINKLQKKKIQNFYDKFSKENDICVEYVNYIDKEIAEFIDANRKNELFHTSIAELNHFLRYPWVLQAPLPDRESSKFQFSAKENRYFILALKIFRNKKLVAFSILRIRDAFMNIPFTYYAENNIDTVCLVVFQHIYKLNIYSFTSYNNLIINNFSKFNFPTLKTITPKRGFSLSKQFGEINIRDYYIHDGDGDCKFT